MILFALTSDIKQSTDYADLDSLLYGISNGDKKCLEQLYQVTHTSVYSFALSVLKNHHDAEDVLHDCYVAVWNGAESYVSRGKPMAWIITIAKNLCLQRMRERKKAECTSQEGWELAIPDTDMLTMEDRSILVTCMEQLSDEERQKDEKRRRGAHAERQQIPVHLLFLFLLCKATHNLLLLL